MGLGLGLGVRVGLCSLGQVEEDDVRALRDVEPPRRHAVGREEERAAAWLGLRLGLGLGLEG